MLRMPILVLMIMLLATSCAPVATPALRPDQSAATNAVFLPVGTSSPHPMVSLATQPATVPAVTTTATSTATVVVPTVVHPTATAIPTVVPTLPPSRTVCEEGCDHATIREAIESAAPSGEIILVVDPVHTEAGIEVNKNVTLRGLGREKTIVQAADSIGESTAPVFIIPAGITATIESMTIRHGHPSKNPWGGGAASNAGSLTLRNCLITDNQADVGAGVWSSGSLTIIRCFITRNQASKYAPPGFECGSGGGVNVPRGTLQIIGSTIANNRAEGKGGGVFIACAANARFENSTISENRAGRFGGGIGLKGTLSMAHCTISRNSSGEPGGGLYLRGTLAYSNTIIANNTVGGDCILAGEGGYKGMGLLTSSSYNLVEDGHCQPYLSGDPGLLRLESNSDGELPVHRIEGSSVVIDAIPAEFCLATWDQRGAPRPVPLENTETPCDIGAIEEQSEP